MSRVLLDSTRPTTSTSRAGDAPLNLAPIARYQPLVIAAVAVGAGLIADRCSVHWLPRTFESWWLMAVTAWIGWLLMWRSGRVTAAAIVLAISLVACGGAWHHLRWNLFAEDELGRSASNDPQPVCVEVVATTTSQAIPMPPLDPLRSIPARPESRFIAAVVAARDGQSWRPASGRTRIVLNGSFDEIQVGDRLRLFGQLARPAPPANPGEFDFAEHSRADRQLSAVRVEFPQCAQIVGRASPWAPSSWLHEVRQRGSRLLHRYLSANNTALASALLLGQREQIDRETNDAFLQTGTIHILSISGLHVAILAWILFKAFRTGWMSRRAALAAVAIVTGIYMLLTGAEPPVVRATILVWIVCGSILLGRSSAGLNSLALAALVIVAMNPADLFRTGVQLSFLSVGVLIWVVPKVLPLRAANPLDRLISATRPLPQRIAARFGRYLTRTFFISAVLWLLIAPLTMARFHMLSPAGLILNLLLAPIVMLLMAAGFAILIVGGLVPPLGAALGWLCDLNLSLLNSAVQSASHWSGSYFWTPGPSDGWLAGLYLVAVVTLAFPPATWPARWRVALACGWGGAALLAALPGPREASELRCTFVSVGHGCAVVMEFPDGKTLLYDAGSLGSPLAAERSISSYLWSRRIMHLDAIIVSHADADHFNALPGLLDKFNVGVIYVGPGMFEDQTPALRALRQSFDRSGAQLHELFAGDRLQIDNDVSIDVLHPPQHRIAGSDNANSIVLLLEYSGKRILLTGDLESPGLEALMNEPRLDCNIVLAPHHGSSHSDPPGFAAWCLPNHVVISGGRGDDSASVRQAYERRAAKVWNTAMSGAVTARVREGNLFVESFRDSQRSHSATPW
ncbi:MAG: ComEC/Rec2 family competence protein [Pirellulales bacterium]|nr:ComEC/Rec2 family competence protein [Pirellulales bacterium]